MDIPDAALSQKLFQFAHNHVVRVRLRRDRPAMGAHKMLL
jgi:hypothetical protein